VRQFLTGAVFHQKYCLSPGTTGIIRDADHFLLNTCPTAILPDLLFLKQPDGYRQNLSKYPANLEISQFFGGETIRSFDLIQSSFVIGFESEIGSVLTNFCATRQITCSSSNALRISLYNAGNGVP
jgi:hypothetical protein